MDKDWFWERNVVESLERHFINLGWTLVSEADTVSRQSGVDLHFQRADIAETRGSCPFYWNRESFGLLEIYSEKPLIRNFFDLSIWINKRK